jgi:heme oxygenase
MSLKDLTKESHTAAENTKFMKAVFAKKLPKHIWADWTYQKAHFYKAIEDCCERASLLIGIEDIVRHELLMQDWKEMEPELNFKNLQPLTIKYIEYINNLDGGLPLAHLYTWHMGDMFGGQMIKKIIDAPHRNLEFKDALALKVALRDKLHDGMAHEANVAFSWAIKLMDQYESSLE